MTFKKNVHNGPQTSFLCSDELLWGPILAQETCLLHRAICTVC